jgi:hypothetical protein
VHVVLTQQPLVQDVESQMHPPWHRWPGLQAGPPLHVHAPLAEHPSPVAPHDEHPMPSTPHAVPDGVMHVLLEQHPLGHDVESQMQLPWEQCWPGLHAGAPLHVHCPDAEHPSPLVPQGVQVPPLTPHAVDDGDTHALFEQQPAAQDVALHTQAPLMHSRPSPQAAPVPQAQVPAAEQLSALAPHWMHPPPFAPQAVAVGVIVHVGPEQHPVGHVVLHPAHVPALQMSFVGQPLQTPPPEPQAACVLPGSQVAPLQHPLQLFPSHTQLPPEQRWPVEHGGPPPHVHAPPEEHPSPVRPQDWQVEPPAPHAPPVAGDEHTLPVQHPGHDIELQTHTPPEHIWPTPQAGPAPQLQTPEGEQLSASLELQETQAIPSVPQLANTDVVHVVPLQHPPGHEVELQMHLPCEQTCSGPQGPDDPQLHAPAAEQLSALAATHAEQATPATPQLANAEVSQVAPEQQPLGQLAAVQPVQAPPLSQF